jgi:hypothetical protein
MAASRYNIDASWEIGQVPSTFPVGFSLRTGHDRQFVAYYDAEHRMTVAARWLDSEQWEYQVLPSTLGWDSHNYVTLALDAEGHLHVSGNMHNDPLIYFRTTKPGDIHSLQPRPMTGQNEDNVCYPEFLSDRAGCLVFRHRDGGSGNAVWYVNRYDVVSQSWSRLTDDPVFDGQGQRSAYPGMPQTGPDGRFHMVWVWRDSPDCATNNHLSYARSDDLVHWHSAEGQPVELPIQLGQQELWIDPVPSGGGIINGGAHLTFDATERPIVTYHKSDQAGNMQIFMARFEDSAWAVRPLTNWSVPIEFSGRGAMPFLGIAVSAPQRVGPDTLRVAYKHREYGEGNLDVDEATMTVTARPVAGDVWLDYPASLYHSEREAAGMEVHREVDSAGDPSGKTHYLLSWETMPANYDRKPLKTDYAPAHLMLYRMQPGGIA